MKKHMLSYEHDYAVQLLSEVPELQKFSYDEIRSLVEYSRIQNFVPGETIILEGEYASWIYLLLAGEIEISKGDKTIKHLNRTGDLVGEMAVINNAPRTATVTAVYDSYLIGFDASVIEKRLKYSETHLCYLLYRFFSEVLASRLLETSKTNLSLRETVLKVVN